MLLHRRSLLAAAPALALAGRARAQSWKAQYPELVFANVPAENASGVVDRWTPFMAYLSDAIGTKVTLRVANDYAAVIEGQKAGNVHIAYYGPASFSKALIIGVKTHAFAIEVNSDGSKGYFSVFFVRADSPYKSIEDLKGKNLGLVDPNSTSGYNMPLYKLDKLGIKPDTFFSKVVVTGSHENALVALATGEVDVAANWWNADDDSNLPRELQDTIKTAFFQAPTKAPEAFARLSDGKDRPWQPITNADYADTIKLVRFVDSLRKA